MSSDQPTWFDLRDGDESFWEGLPFDNLYPPLPLIYQNHQLGGKPKFNLWLQSFMGKILSRQELQVRALLVRTGQYR